MKTTLCLSVLALAGALFAPACGSERDGFAPLPSPPEFGRDAAAPELDADVPCVSAERKAEPVPLAMLVLIDRSGLMNGDKWDAATKAVRAFADRAEVVGMKMGLQFFPPIGNQNICDASAYKTLAVPIGPLPDNVIPIQQRVTTIKADGGSTPMVAGLDGSIRAMRDFIANDPAHQGVVILVTDGAPAGCSGGNVAGVASVAAGGLNPATDLPSVRTFTVGMDGASFANLDQIAQAGGTPKSFDVGGGAAAQQALVEALDEIRAGVIGCEFTLPLPPAGEGILDLESVELRFTPGKNDPATAIKKVAGAGACGATTGGYYYDDPEAPSRVILCPASCTQVRHGTLDAKVDLLFGCIRRPN